MSAWPWGSCMETTLAKLPSLALRPWIWALRTCANSSHCWKNGWMMQVCPWTNLNKTSWSKGHDGKKVFVILCFGRCGTGTFIFTLPCLYLPPLSLCRCCLCREPDIWPGLVQPQCPGLPRHGHRGDQPQTQEEDQYWDQHPSGLRKELSGGERLIYWNCIFFPIK